MGQLVRARAEARVSVCSPRSDFRTGARSVCHIKKLPGTTPDRERRACRMQPSRLRSEAPLPARSTDAATLGNYDNEISSHVINPLLNGIPIGEGNTGLVTTHESLSDLQV